MSYWTIGQSCTILVATDWLVQDMTVTGEGDEMDFARRTERELALASAATDPSAKGVHLDKAVQYATQRELAERARQHAEGAGATDGKEAV